jgi:hypothetical protein
MRASAHSAPFCGSLRPALVTAVPLAASVIKRTALVAYGRCRIRADSIPTTILIPFDGEAVPQDFAGHKLWTR